MKKYNLFPFFNLVPFLIATISDQHGLHLIRSKGTTEGSTEGSNRGPQMTPAGDPTMGLC